MCFVILLKGKGSVGPVWTSLVVSSFSTEKVSPPPLHTPGSQTDLVKAQKLKYVKNADMQLGACHLAMFTFSIGTQVMARMAH